VWLGGGGGGMGLRGGLKRNFYTLIVFIYGLYILELLFVSGMGVGWGGEWKWDSEENLHIINYY